MIGVEKSPIGKKGSVSHSLWHDDVADWQKVPRTGDVTVWESWRLEVVDLDGNRSDKILVSRLFGSDTEVRDIGPKT